jgi:hypothetical protein
MTLLLIVAVWMFVLALVAGLCAAARVGDRQLLARAAPAPGEADRVPAGRAGAADEMPLWESAERARVAA